MAESTNITFKIQNSKEDSAMEENMDLDDQTVDPKGEPVTSEDQIVESTDNSNQIVNQASQKPQKILNLVSKDGKIFKTDWDVACQSIAIREMLEHLSIEDLNDTTDEITEQVPLPNVDSRCLDKVLSWCQEHRHEPDMDLDELHHKSMNNLSDFDREFVNKPFDEIFELIYASNYLIIPGLTGLMCKGLTYKINGHTPEQIRKNFNLEDPNWSAEELKKIDEENAWVYEN